MKAQEIDLRQSLSFNPDEGLLTLGNQRRLLISQDAFATLRLLMIEQLGPSMARLLLARFGFRSGFCDYETLSKMYDWETEVERLAAGPMMHSWSGIVKVEPHIMEMDRSRGHFYFKGIWRNSYEAEIYLRHFGKASSPVCYTLAGYGSGWCTAFFGMPLVEVETKCVACGDEHCEWEIRPTSAWDSSAAPWIESLADTAQSIHKSLEDASRRLREMNAGLEQEVARRTEENRALLRVVCHDLLAPLDMISSASKKLRTGEMDRDVAADNLTAGLAVVRSTLDHVRHAQAVACGKQPIQLQDVLFSELCERLELIYATRLENKSLKLVVENRLAGERIRVDPDVFGNSILSNLISNAIKFSPSKGIIRICASFVAGSGDLSVEISDQGIGIPTSLLHRLFDASAPTSRLGTNGETGTGFGMPLVKTYVEAHGGTIEVASRCLQDGHFETGTTYRLIIPRGRASL